MFDEQHSCDFTVTLFGDSIAPLRAFAAEHREALFHAAGLLAGRQGERIALDAIDALSSATPLARRDRRQVRALLDILSLENVQDLDSEDSARFAPLDPAAPIVEEICLLTDQFRDAIEQAGLDHSPVSRISAAA